MARTNKASTVPAAVAASLKPQAQASPRRVLTDAAAAIRGQLETAFSETVASLTAPDRQAAAVGALDDVAACTAAVAFAPDDQARAAAQTELGYALSTLASITATAAEETRQKWEAAAHEAFYYASRAAVEALAVAI